MTESIVDRVKAAMLHVNETSEGLMFSELVEAMARAAVEAIREPTEAMVRACWQSHHPWGVNAPPPEERPDMYAQVNDAVRADWQAMIDAALSPTKD